MRTPATVTPDGGRATSFGTFLKRAKPRSGQTVTDLAAAAGVSRATYYLLEGDKQRPSLLTAHRLLTALGYQASIPDPENPTTTEDLVFGDHALEYTLRINWSDDDRLRSRQKFWRSTAAGLTAGGATAAGLAAGRVAAAAAPSFVRYAGAALGVSGASLSAAFPPAAVAIAAAAAVQAVSVARKRQRNEQADDSVPDLADMVDDLTTEAQSLSAEELEALLDTLRAMRDRPSEA